MKIHLLSDIHLEFGKFRHTQPECDVVVLAGDIGVGVQGLAWASQTFNNVPIIAIAGNHEFYNRDHTSHVQLMRDRAKDRGIYFLENDTIVIDGVRFIGATLWTDFNLHGREPIDILHAQNNMNDYEKIEKVPNVALRAEDTKRFHQISRQYIVDEMAKPFDGKTVVVTHHLPSSLSISERFEHDDLSPAYASRLEDPILDFNPDLWLHGHVHVSNNYFLGGTRVVSNPRGYVGEAVNEDFDPNLVITV